MDDAQRRRRRVLGWGTLGLAGFYGLSAAVMIPRVENDLTRRVEARAAASGFPGVTATFSGQDGTLHCAAPVADVGALVALAEDKWGVRHAEVSASCRGASPAAAPTTTVAPVVTAAPTTAAPTTAAPVSQLKVAAVLAAGAKGPTLTGTVDTEAEDAKLLSELESAFGVGSVTDQVTVAGIDGTGSEGVAESVGFLAQSLAGTAVSGEAGYDGVKLYLTAVANDAAGEAKIRAAAASAGVADADLDVTIAAPAPGLDASAALAAGSSSVTLSGTVETQAQHDQLVAAATAAFGDGNVVDQLQVLGIAAAHDDEASRLAGLIGTMTPNLVEGTASYHGNHLTLSGVYVSDAAKATVEQAATTAGVDAGAVTLEPRPEATVDQAAQLEQELNDAVGATPIPFDAGKSTLKPEAAAILDQVAALARKYAGVTISVDGHTDGDGSPDQNLTLSQARADTVRQALVDRGVPADQLLAEGFGETQPVAPNDTPENKAKNRRVVFAVAKQ